MSTIGTFALDTRSLEAVQRRPLIEEAGAMLRLAAPIMLIALVNMGMSVTDTVMVSRLYGAEALAAVAVGSDLYSIVFYLGAGVLGGLAPFYTAAVVRDEDDARARLERTGWMTVALLAVALAPIVWAAPGWLGALGLETGLLEAGRVYTRTMAVTLVPMLGVALYRTILTAAEKPKVFLKITLAMLPLNAAANYALMTGSGPLPALGPAGAGVSSLVVATASLAALVAAVRLGTPRKVRNEPFAWNDLVAVLKVGLPIGIATVAEVGIFLAATIYAATLGAADVAAHTLVLRTAGVAYAVPTALLQAAMVRMARAEALDDDILRHSVTVSALTLGIAAGAILFGTLLIGAEPLAYGFFRNGNADVAAAGLATGLLVLLGFMEFCGGPSLAAAGLLRGRRDTRAPMLFTLFGYWVIGASVGLYLSEAQGLGVTGVWIGLTAGMLSAAMLTTARLFFRSARGAIRG